MLTTDACGRRLEVPARPARIVSLCPSQTETLIELDAPVVGRTRYCVHPAAKIARIAQIGGTKNPDIDKIRRLQPDLIIAEKEENRREDVEALARFCPVYVTDVHDFDSALGSVETLGRLSGRPAEAVAVTGRIAPAWQALQVLPRPIRCLYLIWRRPWMVAGDTTYIGAVLDRLGLVNVARDLTGRYPELSAESLTALAPDLCLLSSEPYPFTERHRAELGQLLPEARIELVDGEMFSWYGVRMLESADYLKGCLARWRESLY